MYHPSIAFVFLCKHLVHMIFLQLMLLSKEHKFYIFRSKAVFVYQNIYLLYMSCHPLMAQYMLHKCCTFHPPEASHHFYRLVRHIFSHLKLLFDMEDNLHNFHPLAVSNDHCNCPNNILCSLPKLLYTLGNPYMCRQHLSFAKEYRQQAHTTCHHLRLL